MQNGSTTTSSITLVYATLDAEWRAESSPHDIELEEKN